MTSLSRHNVTVLHHCYNKPLKVKEVNQTNFKMQRWKLYVKLYTWIFKWNYNGWGGPNRTIKSLPSTCGTIWAHLHARLVTDWPPAPTHSLILTHRPLWHSALCDFSWWQEQSALFRPSLWLAGLNLGHGIPGLQPVSSSPALPLAPYFSPFLHPDYSPAVSTLSATQSACVCGAAMEEIIPLCSCKIVRNSKTFPTKRVGWYRHFSW